MNRDAFFASIRKDLNLTTQNVIGTNKILDYAEEDHTKLHDLAYILATAWWESAQTMHPVKEAYWLAESWRKQHLRYFPYYGRGLVQTTWKSNYAKMGKVVGEDLVANPNRLLDWDCALPALFIGMQRGLYTGKDLGDYIDDKDESDSEDLREYTAARRIVNGTDKAVTIARLALGYEHALTRAGYTSAPSAAEPAMPALREGSRGVPVQKAQEALNATGASLIEDGIYGPKTTAAVQEFQSSVGLKPTGVIDSKTWAALSPSLEDV